MRGFSIFCKRKKAIITTGQGNPACSVKYVLKMPVRHLKTDIFPNKKLDARKRETYKASSLARQ
jgi:hypothetical protein